MAILKPSIKPLFIACSGGNGHIAAIHSIIADFIKYHPNLPSYKPVLYHQTHSGLQEQIQQNIHWMHGKLGWFIQTALSYSNYPILPSANALWEEITALNSYEASLGCRFYIDMLLDVYPAGYESAAIWNIFQREEKYNELKKVIDLQAVSDRQNYSMVYNYFSNLLKANDAEPYTSIINTQGMGLPALCDVVHAYSCKNNNQSSLKIHHYLTDLPTARTTRALLQLNSLQQQQMIVYGIDSQDNLTDLFQGAHFAGVEKISPRNNPLVRSGFKASYVNEFTNFNKQQILSLNGFSAPFIIPPNQQIATLMLGSQASADTISYVDILLRSGYEKIFIFRGKNNYLSEKIANNNPKIILLNMQDDLAMPPLLVRSNLLIIRAGGLSIMEQMALPHNKEEQTILIHYAKHMAGSTHFSSGIRWEDENAEAFIKSFPYLRIEKTSLNIVEKQLSVFNVSSA